MVSRQPANRELRLTVAERRITDDWPLLGVGALLFAVSAMLTIAWCMSMSSMGGMPMPGGWTMSMVWMPGQTLPRAVGSFLTMWFVMMVAMMLPSLMPTLRQHRARVVAAGGRHPWLQTGLVGGGYFAVWTVFGAVAFLLGIALATIEMQQPVLARGVPLATGVVVLVAGIFQLTPWKSVFSGTCLSAGFGDTSPKHDANVRLKPDPTTVAPTAAQAGVQLGLHCIRCCGNLMVILLVLGVMDLSLMAVVAAAITLERLGPEGDRAARAIGAVVIGAGLFLIVQAARPG
jgi:predicted metal-binding membrane protein